MSCNGFNHPPHCNCAFSGGWHGYRSFDPLEHALKPRERRLGRQIGTDSPLAGSYINPAAHCPVCGATVHFYKSPYGGKVYFDNVGPPWPKHPCTDNSARSRKASQHIPWHLDSWQALTNVLIEEESPVRQIYKVTGEKDYQQCMFFFRATEIVMAEIVRVRKDGRGRFSISILDYNTINKTWCTWEGIARTSADHSSHDGPLTQTSEWHDQPVLQRYKEDAAWDACPRCGVDVLKKNLTKHLNRCQA